MIAAAPPAGSSDDIRDSARAARAAGLRHVSDDQPGIRRRRSGGSYSYADPRGVAIRNRRTLARGRKQYRYHARWRELRDETKFARMPAFGRKLPLIRRRVARDNDSFGLTTLRVRQVRVDGPRLQFRFRGKSGVRHDIRLDDARLARIVKRMQELPGEELVQYVDEGGETRRVESADVNAYLKETTGEDFTSKDFRTWAGTLLAARALCRMAPPRSASERQRNIAQAIEAVARQLGNTRAVCRKCYVHPSIIEGYLDARLPPTLDEGNLIRFLAPARRRGAPPSLVPLLQRSLAARRLQGERSPSRV